MAFVYALLAIALVIIGILIGHGPSGGGGAAKKPLIQGIITDLGQPVAWAIAVAIVIFVIAIIIKALKKKKDGDADNEQK
jgi:preprotein translocase subunit SecG